MISTDPAPINLTKLVTLGFSNDFFHLLNIKIPTIQVILDASYKNALKVFLNS